MSSRYRNSFVKRVPELDSRRTVMLRGLRAARRAPSTLSKSSRWSLGCTHPSSPRSGCGAVSAWPCGGGHRGNEQRCAGLAGAMHRHRHAVLSTPGLESAAEVARIDRLAKLVVITKPDSCQASAWDLNRLSSSSRPSRARTQISGRGRAASVPPSCAETLSPGLAELTMGVERVAPNHQSVDFAGPIEDLEGLAVSKQSLHAAAVVDTEGAEDLDRFDGVPHGRVSAE
jgi:hypothetical protein